jgi:hypothetical protein
MTLKSVYEDPLTSTRDPSLLAARAGTTVKSAASFLKDQASSQVSQQWRKPSGDSGVYAPTGAPPGHWQGDVIFFEDYQGVNDRRKAMLTVLNTTTRYAVVRPLLSAKSEKTAEAMRSILEEIAVSRRQIKVLRVDGAGEFKGAFAALMREVGIELEVGEPNTHYRLARTDRFHKTLRQRIGEHFERANTHRWIDVLQDIISNYNSAPHRTLSELLGRSTAPSQVTAAQERVIRQAEGVQASEVRERVDLLGITPGTQVRLLISRTREGGREKHAKSQRRVWTPELFTVVSRNGANSFIVDVPAGEVSVWPFYAMMVVRKALKTVPAAAGKKVDVKVERAKKLEALNISEAEQAAALAAPARPRRERAKRVDYAKLVSGLLTSA